MATTRYTVFGSGGEIVSENRAGVLHDYVPDVLGSTVALLDNTQTQTDQWSYWPYGESVRVKGSTATPMLFCGTRGYHTDSSSGLLSLRGAAYSPAFGRYLSQNALNSNATAGRGANAYVYVADSPSSAIDGFALLYGGGPDFGNPDWGAIAKCMGYIFKCCGDVQKKLEKNCLNAAEKAVLNPLAWKKAFQECELTAENPAALALCIAGKLGLDALKDCITSEIGLVAGILLDCFGKHGGKIPPPIKKAIKSAEILSNPLAQSCPASPGGGGDIPKLEFPSGKCTLC